MKRFFAALLLTLALSTQAQAFNFGFDFGFGGKSSILALSPSATFPLTSSLSATKGTGPAVFTRSTGANFLYGGVLTNYGVNVAAYPDGGAGIAVEPGATNLALYSQDFSNAAWSKTGGNISGTLYTSSDGTANANLFTETSAVTAYIYNTTSAINTTNSQVFSVSGDFKYNTRRYLQFAGGFAANGFGVVIDLVNGTITATGSTGSGVYLSSSIKLVNGYYRVTLTGHCGAILNAGYFDLFVTDVSTYTVGVPPVTPSTKSFFLSKAQIELGSVATSYIPTTTATATRGATGLTIPASNFPATPGWSFPITFTPVATTGTQYIWESKVDASNLQNMVHNGSAFVYTKRVAGTSTSVTCTQALTAGTAYRTLTRSNADNTFDVWLNGTKCLTNTTTSTGVPVFGTNVYLGSDSAGANGATGYLKNVNIYNKILSDTKAVTLSTP